MATDNKMEQSEEQQFDETAERQILPVLPTSTMFYCFNLDRTAGHQEQSSPSSGYQSSSLLSSSFSSSTSSSSTDTGCEMDTSTNDDEKLKANGGVVGNIGFSSSSSIMSLQSCGNLIQHPSLNHTKEEHSRRLLRGRLDQKQSDEKNTEDSWEEIADPPTLTTSNPRKRKRVYGGNTSRSSRRQENDNAYFNLELEMDMPFDKLTISDVIIDSRVIYEFLRTDTDYLELMMEFSSENLIRKWAIVSKEWASVAYKVLRRRYGNRAFTTLWYSSLSTTNFIMKQHLHPNLLMTNSSPLMQPEEFVAKSSRGDNYLQRLRKPKEVATIIAFGNYQMLNQLAEIDESQELPIVSHFIYVVGTEMIFTTPNLHSWGDSLHGIVGANPAKTSNNNVHQYMSSLCIPKSRHFAVECIPVIIRNDESIMTSYTCRRNELRNMGLSIKAILVLKFTDDHKINSWTRRVIESELENSSFLMSLTVVEGEFLHCGMKPQGGSLEKSSHGIIIPLLGDNEMEIYTLVIYDTTQESLFQQFASLNTFLQKNEVYHENGVRVMSTLFALVFFTTPFASGRKPDLSRIQASVTEFHRLFPLIPVHGIGSDKEILNEDYNNSPFCKDTRSGLPSASLEMETFVNTNGRHPADKIVFLIIKYPESYAN